MHRSNIELPAEPLCLAKCVRQFRLIWQSVVEQHQMPIQLREFVVVEQTVKEWT